MSFFQTQHKFKRVCLTIQILQSWHRFFNQSNKIPFNLECKQFTDIPDVVGVTKDGIEVVLEPM